VKAIVQDRYGSIDALALREVEIPALADDEVLVRVRASSVHPDIWHMVVGRPYVLRVMGAGLRRPRNPVPGTDMAGSVEAVGRGVTRFRPGNEVYGETIKGYQWHNGGAFAEYVAAAEDALAPKPANVTFEEAAAVPTSALIAFGNLRGEAEVRPGQRVLINGAGGGVGVFAVQLAKARGAEVTGVDSGPKLDMLRSIGCDHVIDYTREDYTRRGERWDVVVDVASNRAWSDCRRAIEPDGTYVLIGHDHFGDPGHRWLGSITRFFGLMARAPFERRLPKPTFSMPAKREAMTELTELLAAGKLSPVVDRTFPLEEAQAALRYLESGAPAGKVVLTV
jgi:NADPH:quinone reductase-like Zn-dependent oxidoreductase